MTNTNTIINETVNTVDTTNTATNTTTAQEGTKPKKKTIIDMYLEVKAALEESERTDLVDFINSRIELENKRKSSRKLTKTQEENQKIKTSIVELLQESEEPMRNGDIASALGISPQKASTLLSQLRKDGQVKRTYEKKIAYFSLEAKE